MSAARDERQCILLGAGASTAVGMPSARELTERVVTRWPRRQEQRPAVGER